MAQYDIKRVLAYSTVSQLGYMFLACGVGAFVSGIFHLMTHAFFKALLFLGRFGLHGMHGEQDMRYMGGLRKQMPITYWNLHAGYFGHRRHLSLRGFFSKDEFLFYSLVDGHILYWGIATVAAGITAFYKFPGVFHDLLRRRQV